MAGGAVLNPAMATFLIDVPVPSMGATVSELVVISLKVAPGDLGENVTTRGIELLSLPAGTRLRGVARRGRSDQGRDVGPSGTR